MSDGILVAQISDDDKTLEDNSFIKFISAAGHHWCNNSISKVAHLDSKKYVLLSVAHGMSFDEILRSFKEEGLGLAQKWFGDSKDVERSIQVVDPFIEDDGSYKLRCAVDRPHETKNPVHMLENVTEGLSVSPSHTMVNLHNGKCLIIGKKAKDRLDFTPFIHSFIGYLSMLSDADNKTLMMSILNETTEQNRNSQSNINKYSLPQLPSPVPAFPVAVFLK